MNSYSFLLFSEVFFLSDFLFMPIKDVFLLNQSCIFKPFVNPVVKEPIKNNPMNNHISLSKNINNEKACPDLTISVRGSKGSNSIYLGINKHNI